MVNVDWAVVTTCAEPRRLLEAFVAHHLAIGAQEIFIFFDDPADGLADAFSRVPKLTCVNCDSAYWTKRMPQKGRPPGHRQRQTHNAEYAARHLCESEWIAHIDVDEFLLPRSTRSISDLLGGVPKNLDAMRVLPAERMFVEHYVPAKIDLSGIFKLKPKFAGRWGHQLYGPELGKLFPNGFQGHEVGKSFKRRTNLNARFNIHFVKQDGENIPHHKVEQDEAVLLHLFPASFEDWVLKYERRIDNIDYFNSMSEQSKKRYSIYNEARQGRGGRSVQELFEALSVLPADSPALASRPDLFLNVDLNSMTDVQGVVKPYILSGKFEHTSQPSQLRIPDSQRVFQIGMNRCGSKEISAMFGRRGMSYAHWDRGQIARDLHAAQAADMKPFGRYDRYQLLSDISFGSNGSDIYDGFYYFEYISRYYKNSIFLLNYRPVDEWLSSRRKFRKGIYIAEHMKATGILSEKLMLEKWASDWEIHVRKVRESARRGELRLIEYSLNTEKPFSFFLRLNAMLENAISE